MEFKRALYVEGIAACIEGGRWDKLEPEQALEGFDHVLLHRGSGDLIIGRLWSSADGKGRARYPMVLCVQTRGIGVAEALPMVLPALEKARRQCQEASDAGSVVRIVGELRDGLRARAANLDPARTELSVSGSVARELADCPAMSVGTDGRQGFHRVMYQMDREFSPFARGEGMTRSRLAEATPRHLRAPACWTDAAEALSRWLSFLYLRVDVAAPITLLFPVTKDWIDIIVGEPVGPEFFCLRASDKLVPPASRVPYTIEPDVTLRIEQFIAEAEAMKPQSIRSPTPSVRPGAEKGAGVNGLGGRRVLVVALLLGALLLLSLGWIFFGPGGGKDAEKVKGERTPTPASFRRGPSAIMPVLAMVGGAWVQPDASVREEMAASSEAVNAFWREQRARLSARYGPEQGRERVAHASRLEAALVSLDTETAAAVSEISGAGSWRDALGKELLRRRELRFRQAFAGFEGRLIDPARVEDARTLDAVAGAFADLADRFAKLGADLQVLEAGLDPARMVGSPSRTGQPQSVAEQVIARWENEGLLKESSVRGAVRPLLDRVEELSAASRDDDTASLLARVAAERLPGPGLELAVWRRLGTRPGVMWPLDASDLAAEVELGGRIGAIAGTWTDASRAGALREEVAAEQKRRLIRMLAVADQTPQFQAVREAMPVFGVGVTELDTRLRFNLLLNQLKVSLQAGPPSDARAAELARGFLGESRGLPGGVAYLAEPAAPLKRMEDLLSESSGGRAAVDPRTLGPGSLGAERFEGHGEGELLSYMAPGGKATLTFVRINPGAGSDVEPFYLGTTEVSVGMFVVMMRGASIGAYLPRPDPAADTRLGPRTWEWRERGISIQPARQWLSGAMSGLSEPYLPGEPTPTRPSAESPMEYITPQGAACAAAFVGCRLPTSKEWRAADVALGAVEAASLNIRDQTWERHRAFVDKEIDTGRNVQRPDAGSVAPGSGGAAGQADDHLLWFANVGIGGGEVVHHLRGNVAEWVLDSVGEACPAEPRSDEAKRFFQRNAGGFGAAGGSALSVVEQGEAAGTRAVKLRDASEGYADVGFRLAFSAGGGAVMNEPLANRIDRVLTPAPYLKMR